MTVVGSHIFDVTPSDTIPVEGNKGLIVEGAGDVSITTRVPAPFTPVGGTPVWVETTAVVTCTAGKIIPIVVHRVNATGTTAVGITGFR